MVEVMGTAPMSCPVFDLYHQTITLFIPDYDSIVKFNISLIWLYLQYVLLQYLLWIDHDNELHDDYLPRVD